MALPEKLYLEGEVTDAGALVPFSAPAMAAGLKRFAGGRVIVEVRAWTRRRSNVANAYVHAVLVKEFSRYTGYTKKESWAILKQKFAGEPKWVPTADGGVEEVWVPIRTSTMSQERFAQFVDEITVFLLDIGALANVPEYEGDRYVKPTDEDWQ